MEIAILAWFAYALAAKVVQLALIPSLRRATLAWMSFEGPPPFLTHPAAELCWIALVALPPLIGFAVGVLP